MKKYIFSVFLSLFIGFLMSYFVISRYDNLESITINSNATKIYYITAGVFNTKEEMLSSMKNYPNYIYEYNNDKYYAYIGITKNKKNSEKLKEFYKSKGYDIYIREKITDKEKFIEILNQYDSILSNTDDNKTIEVICNQVLSIYEEMIKGEY